MKPPYKPEKDRRWNKNFFLCGNSGSGKTHLSATYTKGPVHFYMVDKGGENTLDKLISERPKQAPPISVDIMSQDEHTFSTIYHQIAKDEKDGLMDEIAAAQGMVVIDSLTSLNEKAKAEIGKVNQRTIVDVGKKNTYKGLQMADWGQLLQWMTHFIGGIQDFPCATVTTVHLHTIMDGESTVVGRYPSLNGQFRQTASINFDETYLLEMRAGNQIIHFKEHLKFEAKSRIFSAKQVRNYTMDQLCEAYLAGDTLKSTNTK